jgi:hypothetical protein
MVDQKRSGCEEWKGINLSQVSAPLLARSRRQFINYTKLHPSTQDQQDVASLFTQFLITSTNYWEMISFFEEFHSNRGRVAKLREKKYSLGWQPDQGLGINSEEARPILAGLLCSINSSLQTWHQLLGDILEINWVKRKFTKLNTD